MTYPDNMKTHKVIKSRRGKLTNTYKEVKPGDQLITARGEPWELVSISRVPGFSNGGLDYSNGKIIVTRPGESHTDPSWQREFYPSVFDLKIVERHPDPDDNLESEPFSL